MMFMERQDKIYAKRVNRDKEGRVYKSEFGSSSDSSHYEGDHLMVRRLMSSLVNEDSDSQRENIFRSRCQVMGKLCSLFIDRGSSVNVASLSLVKKLSLPTLVHPRPYKLQWFSEKSELVMDRQVPLAFTLGKYSDEILFIVGPIEATHILVGNLDNLIGK
ncbi:hypothetical protein CR513_05499, partial [Mucuna pruriens]